MQLTLGILERSVKVSKTMMQPAPGTDKLLIFLLEHVQQPGFAPEPTDL